MNPQQHSHRTQLHFLATSRYIGRTLVAESLIGVFHNRKASSICQRLRSFSSHLMSPLVCIRVWLAVVLN